MFVLSPQEENPNIYSNVIPIPGEEDQLVQYKYRILSGDERDIPNEGTEIIGREFNKNRFITLSAPGVAMFESGKYTFERDFMGSVEPEFGIAAPGDIVSITFKIGEKNYNPFIYGIAFKFLFDPEVFAFHKAFYFNDLADFEFLIPYVKGSDLPPGELDLSITSTTGEGTDVGGEVNLFEIDLRVIDDAKLGATMFDLSQIMAVNSFGINVPVAFNFKSIDIQEAEFVEVRPGDTNNDGMVSVDDILPIGQNYNEKGFPRNNDPSIVFSPQTARVWQKASATFADGTGDGVVNVSDILPIGVNFGKSVVAKQTQNAKLFQEFEPRTIEIPILNKGDFFRVSLTLGSEESPESELLGLAFTAQLSHSNVYLSRQISGEILGNSEDLIVYSRVNKPERLISVAATRTAIQGPVNGFGNIFSFEYVVEEEMTEPLIISIFDAAVSSLTTINKNPLIALNYDVITSIDGGISDIPTSFELNQNYPNPFNPSTTIKFAVPSFSNVKIQVFNAIGQSVMTLTDKAFSPGEYSVSFDASNLPSGMYIYRLTTGSTNITKKMILVK